MKENVPSLHLKEGGDVLAVTLDNMSHYCQFVHEFWKLTDL